MAGREWLYGISVKVKLNEKEASLIFTAVMEIQIRNLAVHRSSGEVFMEFSVQAGGWVPSGSTYTISYCGGRSIKTLLLQELSHSSALPSLYGSCRNCFLLLCRWAPATQWQAVPDYPDMHSRGMFLVRLFSRWCVSGPYLHAHPLPPVHWELKICSSC